MARKHKPRRWERSGPSGFVAVDKPQGWTSHDVVDAARRWFGTRQVGHLGTLDPLATGVLPLALRSATKLVPFLEGGEKGYVGTIRLGETTDTLDADGEVLCRHEGPLPEEAAVRDALGHFLGEIDQVPPMYSAVKQDGVPLHKLARQGREVERPPKRVRIDRLELRSFSAPDVDVEVACSAGTYVRVIASDLGVRLGCGGHLKNLCRTRSGPFTLEDAVTDKQLAAAAEMGEVDRFVIPPVEVLGFPVIQLDESDVTTVRHGGEIAALGPPQRPGSCIAALEPGGRLLAVMEVRPGRRLHPVRVLPPLAPQG
ncbi:MAG: tRNA pseudouridine(55) synthase TruB [Deltaproteobacteria bacterium]|nr:tRNA pseudouridine(55) synthase TruB [Deltaproteobacteria bacterium]MBW2399255.1 tRNA pseudouridine(55) synthase TruB [Deltaproteobacteria bacterium]MBW2666279.1 tRNA pseudouridine(55) synthase TruB [Deltaproteobacteria bacterium]